MSIYIYNLSRLGDTGNKANKAWDTDIRHFPRTIGIFIFALEGITVVLPLEAAMRDPKYFMTIVDAVIVGLCMMLFTFGEIGYMVNGEGTEDMATKNLPKSTLAEVLMSVIMLNLVCTFPVQMFPVTEILDKELLSKENQSNETYRTILRLVCVLMCAIVAISLPHFGSILGVMGGVCFCSLGVLFPTLFYLILFEESLSPGKFWGLISLAVVGSAVSMLVTINSIIDLVYGV